MSVKPIKERCCSALGLMLLGFCFFFFSTPLFSSGFSTKVLRIGARNFPEIELTLKVFTREPTELSSDNFKLYEDETSVARFTVKGQKPTQYIVLAIDRSSSIAPDMDEVKRAAGLFINTMPENVKAGIVSFGSDIDVNQKFTDNRQNLLKSVQKIRPYGGTCLYDAIWESCQLLSASGKKTDIKTIVILSDGQDSNPRGTGRMSIHILDQVLEAAKKIDVKVYTIGLGRDVNSEEMNVIAKETGGAFLPVDDSKQLKVIYQKLGDRFKLEQYLSIEYSTPKPERDGSLRHLNVKSSWKGMEDQGSGSYYAPEAAKEPVASSEPSKGSQDRTFDPRILETEVIPVRQVNMDREEYYGELIKETNERLLSIYKGTNKALVPILLEWNQKVESGQYDALPSLREQAFHYTGYAREKLLAELCYLEKAAAQVFEEQVAQQVYIGGWNQETLFYCLLNFKQDVVFDILHLEQDLKINAIQNIVGSYVVDIQNKALPLPSD